MGLHFGLIYASAKIDNCRNFWCEVSFISPFGFRTIGVLSYETLGQGHIYMGLQVHLPLTLPRNAWSIKCITIFCDKKRMMKVPAFVNDVVCESTKMFLKLFLDLLLPRIEVVPTLLYLGKTSFSV